MSLMANIRKMFYRPKVFLVDEDAKGCKHQAEAIRAMNVNLDVEIFTDCNKLLYELHSHKTQKYSAGIICENGSKYRPQVLSNFIKDIDPKIQLIIYKKGDELTDDVKTLSLT
jgi:hypothetical protein